jgi:hypothetical protein
MDWTNHGYIISMDSPFAQLALQLTMSKTPALKKLLSQNFTYEIGFQTGLNRLETGLNRLETGLNRFEPT